MSLVLSLIRVKFDPDLDSGETQVIGTDAIRCHLQSFSGLHSNALIEILHAQMFCTSKRLEISQHDSWVSWWYVGMFLHLSSNIKQGQTIILHEFLGVKF